MRYMSLYLKEVNKLKKNKIFKDCNFSDSSGSGKNYVINFIKKILNFQNLKIIEDKN